MFNLAIWIVWLLVLLSIALLSSPHILLSPQFGFIACFIPQAIYAIFYVDVFDLDFSPTTMTVLFLGTGLFLSVSIFCSYLQGKSPCFSTKKEYPQRHSQNTKLERIQISNWKLIIMLAFQIMTLLLIIIYVNQMPGSSFMDKMQYVNHQSKFVEGGLENKGLKMPAFVSYFRSFSYYYGFVSIYLLIHSIVYKYRMHRTILLSSYVLSMIISFLLGSRFEAVALLISSAVQWYFIWGNSKSWRAKLPFRLIVKVVIISIIVIVSFPGIGNLLGRKNTQSVSDYIAVYLSAELKGLDIYVRRGSFGCDISNWQTLYSLVNFAANHLGFTQWKHFFDQPFYKVNNFALGNVTTVFYWFLHDGGFVALIIFTALMAIISQFLFSKATRVNKKKNRIDISIILYSYAFYGIVFSFFSNRFYTAIVSIDMLKFLISLYLIKIFFTKIRLKQPRQALWFECRTE